MSWLADAAPHPVARIALAVGAFAAMFMCIVLFRSAIVEPFRIPGASMSPALQIGDHVFALKYRYGLRLPRLGVVASWDSPRRGDVIVFEYPPDRSVNYVKRVVAIAGDRIAVDEDRPVVNGVYAVEHPLPEVTVRDDSCRTMRLEIRSETLPDATTRWHAAHAMGSVGGPLSDMGEQVVPEGHVFVMGDNRLNSEDSRRWGFVPIDHIKGKVWIRWMSWDICENRMRTERQFMPLDEPA